MVIIKLMGGMGNQLFQYAVGKAVSAKSGKELKMDISGYENQDAIITPRSYALSIFKIEEKFASAGEIGKFLQNKNKKNISGKIKSLFFNKNSSAYFVEPKFTFNPEVFDFNEPVYLEGYWQTEKYFKDITDIIRKEFVLKDEYSIENKEITKKIKNCNAVSLHIRRGDYVTSATTNKFHGICSLDYYEKAVRHIADGVQDPNFFIFSDDIEWVKENLKIDHPAAYVSDGVLKDYEELTLMSYCKHNIIANSSFSWWGAWLNNNPEKIVIAPKQWFADTSIDISDVIPENWVKI